MMGKREPLGKDPLEWIKRTRPADEDEKTPLPQSARPAQPPPPITPTPGEKPVAPPQERSWLDALGTAKKAEGQPAAAPTEPAATTEPAAPSQPAAPPEPAPPEPTSAEEKPSAQAAPPAEEPIHVQAPPPPASTWPAAVVQSNSKEAPPVTKAATPPDEEEPTEVLSFGDEVEEATGPKLKAEKRYLHVGSTDDEVSTMPKLDTTEYTSLPFGARQESSLLFPIILIICIFLMGLLVGMWATEKIGRVENRVLRLEKLLKVAPVEETK